MPNLVDCVNVFKIGSRNVGSKWGFHNLLNTLMEKEYNQVCEVYEKTRSLFHFGGGVVPAGSLAEMEKIIAKDATNVLPKNANAARAILDKCEAYFERMGGYWC